MGQQSNSIIRGKYLLYVQNSHRERWEHPAIYPTVKKYLFFVIRLSLHLNVASRQKIQNKKNGLSNNQYVDLPHG